MQPFTGFRLCLLCQSADESHDHIFFFCTFTNPIWRFLQSKCRLHVVPNSWVDFINWVSHQWRGRNLENLINKLVLSTTVNQIWMERNERAFTNQRKSQNRVLNRSMELVKWRLLSISVKDSPSARRIVLDWDLPQSFIKPPPELD
ncbi:uncharacterized protein LOC132272680 [Cornus florida]|uniref:uncharacterized protein LOC132272680 n=1 Tax=Cornus florida TaxID=4283 RepID=UPI002897F44E|nr:uncharacterized protein LOC132272680 [Cornus florida]